MANSVQVSTPAIAPVQAQLSRHTPVPYPVTPNDIGNELAKTVCQRQDTRIVLGNSLLATDGNPFLHNCCKRCFVPAPRAVPGQRHRWTPVGVDAFADWRHRSGRWRGGNHLVATVTSD